MARVRLERVTKRFGSRAAVQALSLDIPDRQFVSIVGPSGCGKTTTLRMIAGLERPDEGTILFEDQRVDHLPANHRDIAMVFQSYALYPHMDVRANLAFPLRMIGMPKAAIEERVLSAAKRLGISEFLDHKPRQLSGGQRQRVALGRAIVREPAVFLMDEPLSNLDAQLRVEMRAELRRLHLELARTFIYVTHDQAEALTMSDLVAVMDNGVLQQVGTHEEIYHQPRNLMVAKFIGSPAMNLIRGGLHRIDDGAIFHDAVKSVAVPMPQIQVLEQHSDRAVILGVRPEEISIGSRDAYPSLQGSIYVSEPLGSDLFLTVRVGEHLIKVRTNAQRHYRPGEFVTVVLDPHRLHLFDASTELSLAIREKQHA